MNRWWRVEGGRIPRGRRIREILLILAITLGVALQVKIFIVDAVHIPSHSMEKTLRSGDFLLVNRLLYGPSTPQVLPFTALRIPSVRLPPLVGPRAGDVIVFRFPGAREDVPAWNSPLYVKRLIGLPGQRIEIRNGRVIVDGVMLPPFPDAIAPETGVPDFGPRIVPEDQYFVLGDNLADSYDSRSWGCVPADHIVGKAFLVYWSVGPEGIRWTRIGKVIK
jgi:signal peptidase I